MAFFLKTFWLASFFALLPDYGIVECTSGATITVVIGSAYIDINPAYGISQTCRYDDSYDDILYVHNHKPVFYILISLRISDMRCLVLMVVGTRGRRSTFSIIPMSLSKALQPAGLPSTKSNL